MPQTKLLNILYFKDIHLWPTFPKYEWVKSKKTYVSIVLVASESHGGQTEQDQNLHSEMCVTEIKLK